MKSRYSVVIAGAGPTGLMLANLLGQAGVSVLLVEANDATVSEPRAVSIDDESLRAVQHIGLLDIVEPDIVQGYGSEYRSPAGKVFLTVKPEARPYGHPRRNAFRQPILERQMKAGLERWASVDTMFQCRVASYAGLDNGVSVDLEHRDGTTLTLETAFLIGCDGASSSVREQLGFTLEGRTASERWLIVDLENSPTSSTETIVFCDPERPAIALPGPHQTRRYEFKLINGETDRDLLDPARIEALLHAHGAAPQSRIIRSTVYHFHARLADHWGRGRVWLAGDAAHLMPPFAGQGMNSGIRDAVNLAWKLHYVLTGRIGEKLLETYEQERRGHVRDMIRLAARMGRIMGPESNARGRMTRAGFHLLGLWPAARSYFAEMKYKPPPRITTGFVVASMVTRRGIVGRMLPQPKLTRPGGVETLFDNLLGHGFVLLGIGGNQGELDAVTLGDAWDRLIERRLLIDPSDVPALARHAGYCLIIRPDRYVVAKFKYGEWASVSASLNALLVAMGAIVAKSTTEMALSVHR